ncbi:methyltransferase [Derxia lacustris]|uniref:methyltransferase n=1 Tax=Derxia lacustris TaxID=764842 RepID=UPI000A174859|nr:class I SAM-dependent methyltransferase [Derxia lacustris]
MTHSPSNPAADPAGDTAPAATPEAPETLDATDAAGLPLLHWTDSAGGTYSARWRSEAGVAPPKRVVLADDRIPADVAYRLACEGTALLWTGDFQNARQLLQAMARRIGNVPERKQRRRAAPAAKAAAAAPEAVSAVLPDSGKAAVPRPVSVIAVADFHRHRLAQAQRARTLGMLLIPLDADYGIPLRRAPDVRAACQEVWGAPDANAAAVSLRELLGLVGAHEWRRNGVEIGPLAAARIHPHYGVFSPVRGEYLALLARAPLPERCELAFDIGTGTGVIAALLAQRGVARVVATDIDPRALACATENLTRLGYASRVRVEATDLFPAGRAQLVVCNPPWLPGKPAAPVERAIYDPDSQMLRGFLAGLAEHLAPGGEGWLVMSDLAEHLGLRTRAELKAMFEAAGLVVVGTTDMRPRHPKALDPTDPLHAARMREVTRLWRLAAAA